MAETYCGKTCGACTWKEQFHCAGCKSGPGRNIGGDCDVAVCARKKGHESCDTCGYQGHCATFRGRDQIPVSRAQRMEADRLREAAIARKAPVFGKWLWILFWLVVPSNVGSLMTSNTLAMMMPGLFETGQIVIAACSLAYGAILLRLSTEEQRYRLAGIFTMIVSVCNAVEAMVEIDGLWLLLPVTVLSLIGIYHEHMAHSSALYGVNDVLSQKWKNLWKWFIGSCAALLVGPILMFMMGGAAILAVIVLVAAVTGLVVTSITKLVYLYRTAKVFREYPAAT